MANRNDRRSRTARGSSSRVPSRASSQYADSGRPSTSRATRATSRASGRQAAERASAPRQARTQGTRRTFGEGSPSRRAARAKRLQREQAAGIHAEAGGRYEGVQEALQPQLVSTSVGELRRSDRFERMRKTSRRYLVRLIIVAGIVVALLVGWAALYNSPAFSIANVQVNGVQHLTSSEMAQLANVPSGTTLLRVDTETIRNRLLQNAWVEDAEVKRAFPDTLVIDVTERSVKAVVEIPTSSGSAVKQWAIAEDHMWLMPIPDAESEAAKTTSAQIYADAEAVLHIVDVPYGTKAEIGKICSDDNVNNALDIVSGMTTDLASHVQRVSAAGPAETTLILDTGVEVAFGKAEDIRDKERVILKILQDNPDGVAYINVRMVETPTWRGV